MTLNYSSIEHRTGLPVKSTEDFVARFNNLENAPVGLMFAKECNQLLSWLSKAGVPSDLFTAYSNAIRAEISKRSKV